MSTTLPEYRLAVNAELRALRQNEIEATDNASVAADFASKLPPADCAVNIYICRTAW